MKLLDRYICREMILMTTFVSVILIVIQSFLMLMQELHYIGEAKYGLPQVFAYVFMQMPAQFYQLFPIAGFLGCLIGLSRLAHSSQLVVMRASGISIVRIAWSVMKTAFWMMLILSAIGEGLGPLLQQQSILARQLALHTQNNESEKSIWLREDNVFTHIQQIKTDHHILGVTRYYFKKNGPLQKVIYADSGKLIHDRWILSQLKSTFFYPSHTDVQTTAQANFNLLLKPHLQIQMDMASAQQSLWALYRTIRYRRSIGLSVNSFIFSFWQRLLQPIASLIMINLSVLFVFGALRSVTMGLRILMGVVLGFSFYMLNQLFGPISLVYQFPPVLAAATPILIFLVIFIVLLIRMK